MAMGAHRKMGIWGSGWSAPTNHSAATGVRVADFLPRTRGRFVVMYHGAMTANRGLMEALEGFRLAIAQRPTLMLMLLGDGSRWRVFASVSRSWVSSTTASCCRLFRLRMLLVLFRTPILGT